MAEEFRPKLRMVLNIAYVSCTPKELAWHLRQLAKDPNEGRWSIVSDLKWRIAWEYDGPAPHTEIEIQRLWMELEERRDAVRSLIGRLARLEDDVYLEEILDFIGVPHAFECLGAGGGDPLCGWTGHSTDMDHVPGQPRCPSCGAGVREIG